ncbi:MAG TPA: DUF362 domain-containing protein [Longimicrobiales bacterium]|nr:DUF362 domain-containing protein [Longimicrobiales bacterium]
MMDQAMDRRRFLRATGLGLAALPALGLDGFASAGPAARTRVALVRTPDRRDGVKRALALLDLGGVAGRRIVLKPNFNSADPAPASTHPDTLAQLVVELHEAGARSITLGESSGPTNTHRVMEAKGVFDQAADLRFDVVDYDGIGDGDWVRFGPAGTHWPEGFWLPRHVVGAEYNVSTACLKTHQYGGVFTMSLKLSVGLTPKPIRRGMHRSPDMRRMIAELNTGYRPRLVVLDGVEAFTDGGPSSGELKRADVVIAGTDRVAVDAVGLAVLKELGANEAIMGRPIFQQEQIARAVELGLGVAGPAAIQLVTDDEAGRAYAAILEGILAPG